MLRDSLSVTTSVASYVLAIPVEGMLSSGVTAAL